MQARFESLKVVYIYSSLFSKISSEADAEVMQQISQSGAHIMSVELGSQGRSSGKQIICEKWML